MTDSMLIEMAGMEDLIRRRIERLETLEFETVAFPAGGGFRFICEVLLAAPAVSVTLCPVGEIPLGRHLWLVIAAAVTADVANKMEININGDFTARYRYYVREEFSGAVPVGSADTEVDHAPGIIPFGDTKWLIAHPSAAGEVIPEGGNNQGACLVQFPDYASTDMQPYQHWFSFADYDKDQSEGAVFIPVIDSGGGSHGNNSFPPPFVAITSITITAGGGQTFQTGSQFTLYGL